MKQDRSITALIFTLAGLMACGLYFALMYTIATLACLRTQSTEPAFDVRFASIAMTVILLSGLVVYVLYRLRNAPRHDVNSENDVGHFLNVSAIALGLLAIIAVLWMTLPAFMIADCRTQ